MKGRAGVFATVVYSDDETKRYTLSVKIDSRMMGPVVQFIMLNPSTASHEKSDPTVTRCIGFARKLDASEVIITNLSPTRSTDPKGIIGEEQDKENLVAITRAANLAQFIICAWGGPYSPKALRETVARLSAVVANVIGRNMGKTLLCLDTTRDGHPRHPLYLRSDLLPIAWAPRT